MLPDNFPQESIRTLAEKTSGLSGSDLKEMCRDAAMVPVREYMRERGGRHEDMVKGVEEVCRSDLLQGLSSDPVL